ncbi:hypothetical protein KbCgl_18240 [Corynebacterium glutamicum]|nr:hypothetical protein KbCgl_18240 [Corynebacterium glutamicum]
MHKVMTLCMHKVMTLSVHKVMTLGVHNPLTQNSLKPNWRAQIPQITEVLAPLFGFSFWSPRNDPTQVLPEFPAG